MSEYKSPLMREVCIFGTQADLNKLAIGMLPPEMAFVAPGEPPLFHLMTPEAYHAEFDDDEDDETPNDEPIDEEGDE